MIDVYELPIVRMDIRAARDDQETERKAGDLLSSAEYSASVFVRLHQMVIGQTESAAVNFEKTASLRAINHTLWAAQSFCAAFKRGGDTELARSELMQAVEMLEMLAVLAALTTEAHLCPWHPAALPPSGLAGRC